MSTTTTNLGLTKLELTDPADITQLNKNWDMIDAAIEDCAADIPVTSEVPEDINIWIDPEDTTVEDTHITDKNNPHEVTYNQVGAIRITKLWENPSPTSNFSTKTISLKIPEGAMVAVVAGFTTGNIDRTVSGMCNVGESVQLTCGLKVNCGREIRIRTTGVTVCTCYEYPKYNDTNTEANNRLIPLRFYLIEGVV